MKIVKQCDDAYVIKNLFNFDQINDISDEIIGPYHPLILKQEHHASSSDPQWLGMAKKGGHRSDNMPAYQGYGDNPVLLSYGSKITLIVKKILKPNFNIELRRINTNIQFQYQDSSFHHDGYWAEGDRNDSNRFWTWTFLMFVQDHWDTTWGGEFCYQTVDGNYNYVPYLPGDCVLFNGWLQHKGAGPNGFAEDMRVSCAWTYWCQDLNVDWRA